MNLELSSKYIEIATTGTMDDMYDFGYKVSRQDTLKEVREKIKQCKPDCGYENTNSVGIFEHGWIETRNGLLKELE